MTSPNPIYPTYHSRRERVALSLVLIVLVGLPIATFGYQQLFRSALTPVRIIEMTGRLPTVEYGGWAPETIRIMQGERVMLRLISDDVVHGFAIPKLGIDVGWVEPGKIREIEFVADQPGRYEFLCTVWCEDGHWRMRGMLEVIDGTTSSGIISDPSPPQTDWVSTGINIDDEHIAEVAPAEPPDAVRGQQSWKALSMPALDGLLSEHDFRLLTPADMFMRLPELMRSQGIAADSLSESERWNLVAYLWSIRVSQHNLAIGERNYQRDCTGCHGPVGHGDGPGAEPELYLEHGHKEMARPATDFSDLAAQMGASDMVYYAKLVRGGMGTSMPHWGGVYTEAELWSLIAYLRSFAFDYSNLAE